MRGRSLVRQLLQRAPCQGEAWSTAVPGLKAANDGCIDFGCLPSTSGRQEDHTYTAARSFTTTSPANGPKFHSVLGKPPPKAKTLNRSNLKNWQESGYDVGMAGRYLEEEQRGGSARAEQQKLMQQLKGAILSANSVDELAIVVDELGDLLSKDLAVAIMRRVVDICPVDSEPSQASSTAGAAAGADATALHQQMLASTPAQRKAFALINQVLPRISFDKMEQMWQLAVAMQTMARLSFPVADVTKAEIVKGLLSNDASRLRSAPLRDVTSLALSLSLLGITDQGLWGAVTDVCSKALQSGNMEPQQLGQILRALVTRGDASSPLWPQAVAALRQPALLSAWATQSAGHLVPVLYALARGRYGEDEPALKEGLAEAVAQALRTANALPALPPTLLASLAFAYSKLAQEPEKLMPALCEAAAPRLLEFKPAHLRNFLVGVATTGYSDARLNGLVADLLRIRGFGGRTAAGGRAAQGALNTDVSIGLLQSLADLGHRDAELIRSLAPSALKALPTREHHKLCSLLYSTLSLSGASAAAANKAALGELVTAACVPLSRDVTPGGTLNVPAAAKALLALLRYVQPAESAAEQQQPAAPAADAAAAEDVVVRCARRLADHVASFTLDSALGGEPTVTRELVRALEQGPLSGHDLVARLGQMRSS